MNWLNSLAGNLMTQFLGGKDGMRPENLSGMLQDLLTQAGGMQGIRERFASQGLGTLFDSWVGSGENQPISVTQLKSGIGAENLESALKSLGLPSAMVLPIIAQFLPRLIDLLTPSGQMEANDPSRSEIESALGKMMES